ncbi:MAG TPA: 30S ribosomal protein S17 [Candidatus Pacearchaeota archaeon]|nr:30S ribosomal protein S17 [Candidatus Parcubacteria bacterium]HNP79788.1 30S ribosomal protein S17 [Candidatus Pacearchaeota archaeon]HOC53608.1 30S ribosomal protein S17 [Candidatus Pacearchaeota archaeon]HQM24668.1 30S ribosomal protein S17 [Candidatus Pacearchaeota archaeon]
MAKKRLTGLIVSNKMEKTVVVKVERIKEHPIYKRRYKVHKKYKAHVENSKDFEEGQKVMIEECRPISKDKKWIVIEKVK